MLFTLTFSLLTPKHLSFVLRMMKTKRTLFFTLTLTSILLAQHPAFSQTDSVRPSNAISTGHSYAGIDLGVTGSDYLGAHNFLWGIVTSIDPTYNIPDFTTYLPFDNL